MKNKGSKIEARVRAIYERNLRVSVMKNKGIKKQ